MTASTLRYCAVAKESNVEDGTENQEVRIVGAIVRWSEVADSSLAGKQAPQILSSCEFATQGGVYKPKTRAMKHANFYSKKSWSITSPSWTCTNQIAIPANRHMLLTLEEP